MRLKSIIFLLTIALFATAGAVSAQSESPSPEASASASPAKHKSKKKAETKATESPAASPAAETAASPEKKKHSRKAKADEASTSASPAAAATTASASPTEKKAKKSKAKTEKTAATEAVPSGSPAKKNILSDLFKPKASPSPAAGGSSSETVEKTAPEPGGGHGRVWVNTDTKVYHKEGSRYYGRTKKGKYMTEAEAIKEGAREAKGEEPKKEGTKKSPFR